MTQSHYDLIIVGGGMIGASLAYALKNVPVSIAIIEAHAAESAHPPSYDDRGIALSYGSQRILDTMGIWPDMAPSATAIYHIHVSDRGHFGLTHLSAKDEQVPALGQVITARAIGQALMPRLSTQSNLTIIQPMRVIDIQYHRNRTELILEDHRRISAKLVVAADGAQSTLREKRGLSVLEHDYQQTAITANITPERPHRGWAYERFTDTGPLALLPMGEHRCSLVWTTTPEQAPALLSMNENEFLSQLQARFGYRLGRFRQVGQRQAYPLKLIQMDQPIQSRLVFIGNAAHSLHPIAGQGFNLGLRDVAALAEVIADHQADCGHARALHAYDKWRRHDQETVISHTHSLVSLFSQSHPLLGHCRGLGLTVLDLLPPVKHILARYSMGLAGKQPRLARGVPL